MTEPLKQTTKEREAALTLKARELCFRDCKRGGFHACTFDAEEGDCMDWPGLVHEAAEVLANER